MPTTKRKQTPRRVTKETQAVSSPVESSRPAATAAPISALQGQNLIILLLVAVLAFGAGYLLCRVRTLEKGTTTATNTTTTGQNGQPAQPTDVPVSMDKIKGLFKDGNLTFGDIKTAKVAFVEITDPSCPYCNISGGHNPELAKSAGFQYASDGGSYIPPLPEMRKLVDDGKAALVELYAPGHGNGELAMQALYCAYEKGKYWDVHDMLMNNDGYNLLNNTVKNDKANIPQLVQYLSGVVDSDFLTNCLQSGKYASKLTSDYQVAQSIGFSGTPHYFINTTAFKGAYSWKDMQPTVDAALK